MRLASPRDREQSGVEWGRFAPETALGGRGVECAWRASGETLAAGETVSGPPCDSSRRFGGVPGILQRAK